MPVGQCTGRTGCQRWGCPCPPAAEGWVLSWHGALRPPAHRVRSRVLAEGMGCRSGTGEGRRGRWALWPGCPAPGKGGSRLSSLPHNALVNAELLCFLLLIIIASNIYPAYLKCSIKSECPSNSGRCFCLLDACQMQRGPRPQKVAWSCLGLLESPLWGHKPAWLSPRSQCPQSGHLC